MTRSLAAIALVAAATIGGVLAGASVAAPATHTGSTALKFVGQVTETSGLNSQGVPSGLGKYGTVHLALHDSKRPQGPTVGSLSAELVVTSVAYPSTILQVGTLVLARGSIAVEGLQAENQNSAQLAITGGTGAFTDSSGTVRIVGSAVAVSLEHRFSST
jgi:hypothetical protein